MLKDIILVAAGMVIVAGALRGGHMVRDEPVAGSWSPAAPDEADDLEPEKGLSRIGWPDR